MELGRTNAGKAKFEKSAASRNNGAGGNNARNRYQTRERPSAVGAVKNGHRGNEHGAEQKDERDRDSVLLRKLKFPICSIIVQTAFVILFAQFADYPDDAHTEAIFQCHLAKSHQLYHTKNFTNLGLSLNFTVKPEELDVECPEEEPVNIFGPPYQDAQFFIVAGLTLLFLGIKNYRQNTMGLAIYIISVCLQWSFLCRGLYRMGGSIKPSPDVFVITVFFAAAVLISWGCILGRASPMQLLLMSLIEIPAALANDYLILEVFKVNDPGGALIYNIFGTYFGLSVSKMLYRKGESLNEEKRVNTTTTETFAFIGSNILWGFWPTSMGAIFQGGQRHRCILNTYFALTGSGFMGTAFAALLDPEGKFTASILQNCVLAGAVAMSGAADTMMGLHSALIVGCCAGILSVITWVYIQPFLATKLHIVDTCGSHTLHGVPAILGAVVSAITAGMANEKQYGESLYKSFPAMAPPKDTQDFNRVHALWPDVAPGEGRSAAGQAGYQMACLGTTFLISIASGLLTGFLMKLPFFDPLDEDEFYEDSISWNMPLGDLRPDLLQKDIPPEPEKHRKAAEAQQQLDGIDNVALEHEIEFSTHF